MPACSKIVRGQESLTVEQKAYARHHAHQRIEASLSTAAICEQEAEEHLREAYCVANLRLPRVRWFDSPVAFVEAYCSGMKDSKSDSVWEHVGAGVGKSVWESVGDIAWNSESDSVEDSVWADVRRSVWASVGGIVWEGVRNSIEANALESVWDRALESVWAYEYEDWCCLYRFFHEVFEPNKSIHLALFNEMVSGYRLGRKEAWVVRKPVRLERDERGRLHSEAGMCIQYSDGWGLYAWHGVRCSESLILRPQDISREDWLNERNLELRRVIQERLGNDRFVELVGGRCIDQGERGDLIEIDLGDDPERIARFVRVRDTSTRRVYYLRVPPTTTHADSGVAWTFGLDEAVYHPQQES